MTHVDLSFPVRGQTIPRDHGYALYGALSRAIPGLHGADWLAIQGIAAKGLNAETLSLEPAGMLRMRVPAEKITELLALAGARLEVAGHNVEIGAPTVHPLVPAATLDARLVVNRLTGGVPKPFDRAEFERRFVAAAQRQLGNCSMWSFGCNVNRQNKPNPFLAYCVHFPELGQNRH